MIGFIGTGGISEAMITGLYEYGNYQDRILISARNRIRSQKLAAKYNTIEIVSDNQTIADRCAWVIIAVLPEQAPALFSALRFRKDQTIISLVAGLRLDYLKTLIPPATDIYRAIPMPPVEYGRGPIPFCPASEKIAAFFNTIGTAIPVAEENELATFAAGSAVMATFFEWSATIAKWMANNGVSEDAGARYTTSLLNGLAEMTCNETPEMLAKMSEACLTPGGLNEQVLRESQKANWFRTTERQLDAILKRLENFEK